MLLTYSLAFAIVIVMNLDEYLNLAGEGSAAELSRKTGIPAAMISQYRHKKRKVPATQCLLIENTTGKRVTRKDLHDDWQKIWPELSQKQNKEVA